MRTRSLRLSILTGLTALILTAAPVLAALTTVSGHAFGESVNVTPLGLANVSSGPLPTVTLPSSGGNLSSSAAGACAPFPGCSILSTGLLNVHTEGATGESGYVFTNASVANVSALGGLVTGTTVASECRVASNGATSGSSTLTNVNVNGVTVASNPGPNTELVLLNAQGIVIGKVILNEQFYDAGTNTLTVNAIHIYLNGVTGTGDIIIASSKCDALPGGPAPVIPDSPLAILLPLTAIAAVGGALLLMARRNPSFLQH